VKVEDLQGILERTRAVLSEQDQSTLQAAVETLAFLTQELQAKGASIQRLRRMLFGAATEKTNRVIAASGARPSGEQGKAPGRGNKPRRPGHGRNGAAAYRGAGRVKVAHAGLSSGDRCPECPKGKVYRLAEPAVLVRVTGMAPLSATVYELDRLRCNLCGQVFTAPAPAGVGQAKYDETAAAMVGLLKYGAGLPFNRIERLQRGMGIPLPAATAWDLVRQAAQMLLPAHDRLIEEAAQGQVLHNDDTSMKILELCGRQQPDEQESSEEDQDCESRSGVFTSAIVARGGGHRIALFFTGRKHAGENLTEVLARRAAELSAPIQMCDALSRNVPAELKTVLANCLAHARRRFVEVAGDFPEECRYLLETLRKVYLNDALARDGAMSAEERLRFHQAESGPLMKALESWLREQIEKHKVEPNSGLGEAIGYMRKHWSKLTLFLHVAGAPLDNNLAERSLKKAILHRKNAMFFKTCNGARVGDAFMTLIHTAELSGVDPFPYLVALQRHHEHVAENPGDWMPWNYSATMAELAGGLPP
jgi:transposase